MVARVELQILDARPASYCANKPEGSVGCGRVYRFKRSSVARPVMIS
jgi:hypothetical protein